MCFTFTFDGQNFKENIGNKLMGKDIENTSIAKPQSIID